jgi:hypothetical protein
MQNAKRRSRRDCRTVSRAGPRGADVRRARPRRWRREQTSAATTNSNSRTLDRRLVVSLMRRNCGKFKHSASRGAVPGGGGTRRQVRAYGTSDFDQQPGDGEVAAQSCPYRWLPSRAGQPTESAATSLKLALCSMLLIVCSPEEGDSVAPEPLPACQYEARHLHPTEEAASYGTPEGIVQALAGRYGGVISWSEELSTFPNLPATVEAHVAIDPHAFVISEVVQRQPDVRGCMGSLEFELEFQATLGNCKLHTTKTVRALSSTISIILEIPPPCATELSLQHTARPQIHLSAHLSEASWLLRINGTTSDGSLFGTLGQSTIQKVPDQDDQGRDR